MLRRRRLMKNSCRFRTVFPSSKKKTRHQMANPWHTNAPLAQRLAERENQTIGPSKEQESPKSPIHTYTYVFWEKEHRETQSRLLYQRPGRQIWGNHWEQHWVRKHVNTLPPAKYSVRRKGHTEYFASADDYAEFNKRVHPAAWYPVEQGGQSWVQK